MSQRKKAQSLTLGRFSWKEILPVLKERCFQLQQAKKANSASLNMASLPPSAVLLFYRKMLFLPFAVSIIWNSWVSSQGQMLSTPDHFLLKTLQAPFSNARQSAHCESIRQAQLGLVPQLLCLSYNLHRYFCQAFEKFIAAHCRDVPNGSSAQHYLLIRGRREHFLFQRMHRIVKRIRNHQISPVEAGRQYEWNGLEPLHHSFGLRGHLENMSKTTA